MKYFGIISIILIFLGCTTGRIGDITSYEGKIAKLVEASGICYVEKSDTLFVVSDVGNVYELDKEGLILNMRNFSELSNYDFEGIAYHETEDQLYIAIEGVDNLLVIDRDFNIINEINIAREDGLNRKILVKDNKHGIEGVTIIDNQPYVVNQSYDMLPDVDPSVILKLAVDDDNADLEEVITVDSVVDMSGMAFYQDFLYVVSDSDKLLVKYDIQSNEIVQTIQLFEISTVLEEISVEGVTFDNDGNIYFVHDDKEGGAVYKYKFMY